MQKTGLFFGLRARLLLLVFLAALPALGLTVYSFLEMRRDEARNFLESVRRLTVLAEHEQVHLIGGAQQLLLAMAQLPVLRNADAATCHQFLADLNKQYPHYANLGVSDVQGDLICTALPLTKPVSVKDRKYFQDARQTGRLVISEYQIGRVTGRAMILLAQPLLDEKKNFQGVVYAAIDLDLLNRAAARVKLPPGATIVILDREGTILARYPDPQAWVGKTAPESSVFQKLLAAQDEATTELTDSEGITRLWVLTRVDRVSGMAVGVSVDKATVFSYPNRLLIRNLSILIVSTLLAIAIAWWMANLLIVRRVEALVGTTQRLAGGELSARTGLVASHSELDNLAQALDQMAVALEEMRSQAMHDPLTGLFNRRYMEEHLNNEIQKFRRDAKPIGIVMVDIDHFKAFNDQYGHQAGDAALVEVGRLLQRQCRAGDVLCRYGGEEFVFIMSNTTAEVAAQRAETLRQAVKDKTIAVQSSPAATLTLSFGVAACPQHGESATAILHAADQALYRAKATGRDCVVLATSC